MKLGCNKIWDVRGNVKNPIAYIENEETTTNPELAGEENGLTALLDYATKGDKTNMKFFVSGINCNKSRAAEQFEVVKCQFDKQGGIVAYHAYQSFDKEEVTGEQAHDIGKQMAKELWGDRFQVVVTTHLNTKHIHNHFVINSISFKDGKRFHDSKATYAALHEASDRHCRKRGLSVIENPDGKGTSHYINKLEKAGMPTRFSVAREAIDEAISRSVNMEEFKQELKQLGYRYQFNPNRKYWTVTPPGWERPIRTHRLGAEYTAERIQERVYANDISVRQEKLTRMYTYRPNNYKLKRRIDKIMGQSGLERLYLRYCYELGYLPKYKQKPTHLHILFKEDLLKCEMYSKEAQLLASNHIGTDAELAAYEKMLAEKIEALTSERDEMRKLVKRAVPEDEKEKAKAKISELTSNIKEIRKELKLCEDIKARSGHIENNLQTVDKERTRRKEVRKL